MMQQLWRNLFLLGVGLISTAIFFALSRQDTFSSPPDIQPLAYQPHSTESHPYLPYPQYNGEPWKRKWKGTYAACKGPDDLYFNESSKHIGHAHFSSSRTPVSLVFGDPAIAGLDTRVCFDSIGRLGPYGYDPQIPVIDPGVPGVPEDPEVPEDSEVPEEPEVLEDPEVPEDAQIEPPFDWKKVRWGALQDDCFLSNKNRYSPNARKVSQRVASKEMPQDSDLFTQNEDITGSRQTFHSRTALLIRSWTGYNYTENELQSIRALITELSLLSGGEYQVFLFVQVKDWNSGFWNDRTAYRRVLYNHVPHELQDITILWNGVMLQEWYPEIGDWQVYWHQFMPLQWFSKIYPDFDYVWNWEVDARLIGNHYHMLEQIAKFAKKAPRKYLWERNARFYIPAAHGTFDEWISDTHSIIETAMAPGDIGPVWGARPYDFDMQQPIGPTPPSSQEDDNFIWGVGEEADLITLLPIWDPKDTKWSYRDIIFNYEEGVQPHFTPTNPIGKDFHYPGYADMPRRVYINTVSRFSRRQLHAMHIENLAGRDMAAEMWPASVALQHGLKAVYAPHPIWAEWLPPGDEMDIIFNADGGEMARWGAGNDSVYNQDREWRFANTTWFFNANFPRRLYERWLMRPESADSTMESNNRVVDGHDTGLCLPQMLLHPVKRI